jgi:hypothetical protein
MVLKMGEGGGEISTTKARDVLLGEIRIFRLWTVWLQGRMIRSVKNRWNRSSVYKRHITMNKTRPAFLILAAALFISAPATAASIINGSFEDNVLANGTWKIFNSTVNDATHSTTLVNGWSSSPGNQGIEIRNNVAGQAYHGNNFVELDTDANSLAYQNIATVAGQLYEVSFAYSTRPGVTGPVDTNNLSVFLEWRLIGNLRWHQCQFHDEQLDSLHHTGSRYRSGRFALPGNRHQ